MARGVSLPPLVILPIRTQRSLLLLAAGFVLAYALALSLAPAARARSWDVELRWEHWLGVLAWLAVFGLALARSERRLVEADPFILPVVALLSGWGLLTIFRLSPAIGLRQTAWLALAGGVVNLGLGLPSDLGFLRRYKYVLLTAGLLLTAFTLFIGVNPLGFGPRLWLGGLGVYFQPSELLKLLLVVYLSAYLADRTPARRKNSSRAPVAPEGIPLAPTWIMTGLALALMLAQRDLGAASILLFLYASVVYVVTGQKRILTIGGLAVLLAGLAGYALYDVVRIRVDAWLNPWLDPSGRSYQIVQSLIAIANGGLFGRGPGLGNPGFVPVPHSDFIFAAIAEETGLAGALGLLGLLAVLAGRGLRAALQAPDRFRRGLAAGLTAYLVGQAIVIIGGNLRLLPLTGVTLPFVSYGGSSLMVSSIAFLLLWKISDTGSSQPHALSAGPVLQLGGVIFVGLAGAAAVSGWWAYVRGPILLERSDNPRRALSERSVQRGSLLDRNNYPLAETTGDPGAFVRSYSYPALGPLLGYNHPVYGLAGLEAQLDPYLRGQQGAPARLIWSERLLYGHPPPGLDVRLSLDLDLQRAADQALGAVTGALVVVNAQTGVILACAWHPGFDGNLLGETWEPLMADGSGPLIDRCTQAQYAATDQGVTWLSADPATPLDMALLAAALSQDGLRPAAWLALAVNTPQAGWVLLPPDGAPSSLFEFSRAHAIIADLALAELPAWQRTWVSAGGETWSLAGTLPAWQGIPLGLVVLIETRDPAAAGRIAQAMLETVLRP